ncbi:hypothetical protein HPB52_018943 [Rhipicephalus sanguineus]|uniref:asparaginase n=1 Tax=Rhipicephalus sanguineus TaxID=34632 RepID=A0A9D4PS88_RHISA|nr:hypothetical protein HPB52_018943 [Rhipicephalus sanguineus]
MAVVAPMDASYVPKVLYSLTDDGKTWQKYSTSNEARVLVIYTGGTIGMVKDKDGVLKPAPGVLDKRLREFPQLHDAEYAKEHFGDCEKPPLVLPDTGDLLRVVYTISEYNPLLDSSNATMDDWLQIAKDIKKYYDSYQGFIVLHGTDTMAYTSSALSFLLENLGKSVVVTGSQVTLMFRNQLFRGNRVSKFSISHLDAFASFNMAPLVTIGINVDITWPLILPEPKDEEFRAHDKLDRDVGLLRLFPSITAELELVQVGVVPGGDMTPEAALTKLAYVLSKSEWTLDEKKKKLQENLRGELTTGQGEAGWEDQYKTANLMAPWKALFIR